MLLSTLPQPSPVIDHLPAPDLALYIHIPFCRTRCTYCAFNTYTGLAHLITPYIQAVQHELHTIAATAPALPVSSLYFGGGTPSLLPIDALSAVLETCQAVFSLTPAAEITLEANPGAVDLPYLRQARAAGITRLSLGMQSAHPHELRLFGRTHQLQDVRTAVEHARAAGFASLNLDLIYGTPRQTLTQWHATLAAALALAPDHLSLYSLSLEDATPLAQQIASGRLPAPDSDRAATMYEAAEEQLAVAGFQHYEISNWARPGHACQHNLHVWRNRPYLGFGAGAHGCAQHIRYANVAHPADYLAAFATPPPPLPFPLSPATREAIALDQDDVIVETIILGLRLLDEGISIPELAARFDLDFGVRYGPICERLCRAGLLARTPDERLRLTPRGRLLANRVFVEFL